jgi:hypothetical protein
VHDRLARLRCGYSAISDPNGELRKFTPRQYRQRRWRILAIVAARLQAARNVGRLVEHGDDHWWLCGAMGYPIRTDLDPRPAWPGEMRIGRGRANPGGQVSLDLSACLLLGGNQPADRLRAIEVLVVLAELTKLSCGPRRKADQRRGVSLRAALAAALASSRARPSRRSRMTTSPATIWPAARSASLSARASSKPAGVGVSSMARE